MTTIETILRDVNREVAPRFEEGLRAALADRDREWLIDQIVRLALDAHSLQALDRRIALAERARARAELDFMRASTELSAAGTWQDPDSVSNDIRADNVILEVEFGEVAGEHVGHGIVRCLSLVNNLEVNEQVLYARMIDVEQSTLIE
jgi:hypothetical protein